MQALNISTSLIIWYITHLRYYNYIPISQTNPYISLIYFIDKA